MSERDFAMALAMLAEAFGEKHITPVRIEAYHQVLQNVPLPLLNAAVRKAITTRHWFPKPSELLEDAESMRVEMRAALLFEPCVNCSKDGWTEREVNGVRRAMRCTCWHAHQQKIQALGVGEQPLALPASRHHDFTAVGDDAA